jgi:probable addiction module antidote protein
MQTDLTNYEVDLLGDLTDPEYAAMYVSSALEGEQEEFLMALRYVAEARTMTKVAEDSKLNRVSLYKILSDSGNPHLDSLRRLLKAMGLRLSVVVDVATQDPEESPQEDPSAARESEASQIPTSGSPVGTILGQISAGYGLSIEYGTLPSFVYGDLSASTNAGVARVRKLAVKTHDRVTHKHGKTLNRTRRNTVSTTSERPKQVRPYARRYKEAA